MKLGCGNRVVIDFGELTEREESLVEMIAREIKVCEAECATRMEINPEGGENVRRAILWEKARPGEVTVNPQEQNGRYQFL